MRLARGPTATSERADIVARPRPRRGAFFLLAPRDVEIWRTLRAAVRHPGRDITSCAVRALHPKGGASFDRKGGHDGFGCPGSFTRMKMAT